MGRISPGPIRWPPGAERRLVPAKSNLKPQTSKEARARGERRGGRPTTQTTHSAEAQGTRSRKPEKAGDNRGAQREEKKNGAPSGSHENRETQRGGGGSNHEGAANGQVGNTNETRAHREPSRGTPTKQTTHSAKARGILGRKPEKAGDNGGAPRRKTKNMAPGGDGEKHDTQTGKGGVEGGHHQAAANGRAEDTSEARAPGEPRSERPTTQTTHSAEAQGTQGRKPKKARDNGGAKGRRKKKGGEKQHRPAGGGGEGKQGAKAQGTRGQKQKNARDNRGGENNKRRKKNRQRKGQPQPGGGRAKETDTAAKGKGEAHQNVPGRLARPTRPRRTSTRTRARDPGVLSSDRKGRCRRPHETAPVHRPSPPSNDGRYGKPDASVTGSTPANHRIARSPRLAPEGPARDDPIAGPRTGTTRSKPSVRASAGASGRHNEPGSRPASACPAQPPSKAEGASPRGGERHHGVGKADQSTESNRTGRGAAHHAGPRGTPVRHAAGHNQGTRTGAKQQRPPGAANPESAHNTHRTTAQEQVPSNTSRRPDGGVCARRVPSPYRLRTAAVRMDECAPEGYPAPAGNEQPPSGWMSERPAATPRTRNTARATQSTAHRASTPVNKSKAAKDTTHAKQHTEWVHR